MYISVAAMSVVLCCFVPTSHACLKFPRPGTSLIFVVLDIWGQNSAGCATTSEIYCGALDAARNGSPDEGVVSY